MKIFSLIVATDDRLGIGKNGGLPWQLKADLKHFRDITTKTKDPSKKNVVIMGRKTWDSLPENYRPLPNRLNVVITRNVGLVLPNDVIMASSLEEALKVLDEEKWRQKLESIFVIGGEKIFRQAIERSQCQELFLTRLKGDFQCDAFFPNFEHFFSMVENGPLLEENGIQFFFSRYNRITR